MYAHTKTCKALMTILPQKWGSWKFKSSKIEGLESWRDPKHQTSSADILERNKKSSNVEGL